MSGILFYIFFFILDVEEGEITDVRSRKRSYDETRTDLLDGSKKLDNRIPVVNIDTSYFIYF